MSGHASAESLSLYLDAQLSASERQRVEGHLESCPACRHRLDGLRRIVSELGRLPAASPPEDLGARVQREIGRRGIGSRWPRLIDGRLPGALLGSPPLHVLALVLALGAIVVLFGQGLELRRERPTRIVPLGAEAVVEPPGWAAATSTASAPAGTGDSLYLLGGRFRSRDGVWVEDGLAGRPPDARVQLDAAMPVAAMPMPEIAELAALGAPLRLRVGDEVVEIAFGAGASAGD